MSIKEVKEKLHDYIETADEKKLNAIYTLVEEDTETGFNSPWDDEDFVASIEKREIESIEYEQQLPTAEDVMARALERIKNRRAI